MKLRIMKQNIKNNQKEKPFKEVLAEIESPQD